MIAMSLAITSYLVNLVKCPVMKNRRIIKSGEFFNYSNNYYYACKYENGRLNYEVKSRSGNFYY